MISVRNLRKSFNGQEVLKGIDLDIAPGEVLAIIGPSGSGKTTLLRCLNLLEQPSGGQISVGAIHIDADKSLKAQQRLIRELRQHVGFVFQNFIARGRALLAKVGLDGKEDTYPRRLSGGQQQRVAIARALAMQPDVILFDEPTSALDPELVGEVLATIRGLAEERRTMVIVTHEMSFARDVADRAIFIDDGVIVEQGDARQLLSAPQHERTRQFLSKFIGDHDGY